MKEARAFSPCHITGFFQISDGLVDPLRNGSRGAGVSLGRGVETTVGAKIASRETARVEINGVIQRSAPVTEHVISQALSHYKTSERLEITACHHTSMPVGSGFGTSGAGALGSALALNEALCLGMSKVEVAQLAHVAEVECKTGLGTVIAEASGGAEIRTQPGAPGIGKIEHLPTPKDTVVICLSFGPMSTRKSLTDAKTRRRINQLGGKLVNELVEKPGLTEFLKLSRQFAEHVGLINKRLRRVLNATDAAGFTCSMPMFGESIFTLVKRESVREVERIFQAYGSDGEILTSEIDFEGARLL